MSGTASQGTRAQHAQALKNLACQWADQQSLAAPGALRDKQQAARDQLHAMAFPDRKTEAWKYTGLTALEQIGLWQSPTASNAHRPAEKITTDAALRLTVLHDETQLEVSAAAAASVEAKCLRDLDDTQLQRYLPLLALDPRWQEHPFAQLCEATLDHGWLIVVKARQKVEKPIVIEQWANTGDSSVSNNDPSNSFTSNLRVLVVVEPGAEATLLHITDSPRDANTSLLNGLIQVHVQDNASLQHIHLQVADERSQQVNVTQTTLNRDSRYQHYVVSLGTALIRNDLHLQFTAAGAEAQLNGAFLSKHAQHVDNHLNLEHISGRCQSTTRYKGLVTDQSRAVFNGRIHIHPDAQKTDAQLNNKNLLLSREAEIDTKPELEIYADDVKCAHGASIGQLDEKALFYFESRGIDKGTAEAMLSFGFINEIVETLPVPGLADAVNQRLISYFRDVKQLGALWQE